MCSLNQVTVGVNLCTYEDTLHISASIEEEEPVENVPELVCQIRTDCFMVSRLLPVQLLHHPGHSHPKQDLCVDLTC